MYRIGFLAASAAVSGAMATWAYYNTKHSENKDGLNALVEMCHAEKHAEIKQALYAKAVSIVTVKYDTYAGLLSGKVAAGGLVACVMYPNIGQFATILAKKIVQFYQAKETKDTIIGWFMEVRKILEVFIDENGCLGNRNDVKLLLEALLILNGQQLIADYGKKLVQLFEKIVFYVIGKVSKEILLFVVEVHGVFKGVVENYVAIKWPNTNICQQYCAVAF